MIWTRRDILDWFEADHLKTDWFFQLIIELLNIIISPNLHVLCNCRKRQALTTLNTIAKSIDSTFILSILFDVLITLKFAPFNIFLFWVKWLNYLYRWYGLREIERFGDWESISLDRVWTLTEFIIDTEKLYLKKCIVIVRTSILRAKAWCFPLLAATTTKISTLRTECHQRRPSRQKVGNCTTRY